MRFGDFVLRKPSSCWLKCTQKWSFAKIICTSVHCHLWCRVSDDSMRRWKIDSWKSMCQSEWFSEYKQLLINCYWIEFWATWWLPEIAYDYIQYFQEAIYLNYNRSGSLHRFAVRCGQFNVYLNNNLYQLWFNQISFYVIFVARNSSLCQKEHAVRICEWTGKMPLS